ncbi:MAG: hypothetical protein WC723_05005 [Candidatus Omnitrophota bacterium]
MVVDKIKAIHSKDMEKYLENIGILADVTSGKYKCSVCNKEITLSNIAFLYPENNEVRFCCDDPHCYEIIIKKRMEKNG